MHKECNYFYSIVEKFTAVKIKTLTLTQPWMHTG